MGSLRATDIYRSATVKLTAWYLAIVVAICLIFSGVVYHFAVNELATGLTHQSQRIYQNFPVFDNDPFFKRNSDLVNGSHHILLQLIEFNVIVFIVAGFASYWLAKRTLQPIEESNEQQKRFTADASHELRTPLTALKMSTEVALLDESASKAELREALTSNLEETNKLDALLNNLLRLSRLEAHEIRHNFGQLVSAEVVEAAVLHVAQQAERKHITIARHTTDEPIVGDHDSLVQVLTILLDNAIKYSPEKSSIEIISSREAKRTNIVIKDHGQGIEPTALRHVFDRFYRADKARTRASTDGFGLGLSIAKHIVDLHHGTITLTSAVGRGTTATLSLPSE